MTPPLDPQAVRAAGVADALRRWLRSRSEYPPELLASAMAYELAALIAREASTDAQAFELLDGWLAMMKDQIRVLGVGVEHP